MGRARRITFQNVPSFVLALDAEVEVPELRTIRVDLAFGGMIYVMADAGALGLTLEPTMAKELARAGEMIKVATREQMPQTHPENQGIQGPTIALLSGPPAAPTLTSATPSWSPPDGWTGIGPTPGPERSTARPAAPEHAPRWRRCTRVGCFP